MTGAAASYEFIGGKVPFMPSLRILCAALGVAGLCFAFSPAITPVMSPAMAQSGGPSNDKSKPAADTTKEGQKKADEIAEATRVLTGPAGNPECVWLGRRVVSLLWRDDLDTAFRHLDLYDRFGCPGPHVQATFRCLIRQGHIDPKAPDTLMGRVHACWLNPGLAPPPEAAAAASPPADKPATAAPAPAAK